MGHFTSDKTKTLRDLWPVTRNIASKGYTQAQIPEAQCLGVEFSLSELLQSHMKKWEAMQIRKEPPWAKQLKIIIYHSAWSEERLDFGPHQAPPAVVSSCGKQSVQPRSVFSLSLSLSLLLPLPLSLSIYPLPFHRCQLPWVPRLCGLSGCQDTWLLVVFSLTVGFHRHYGLKTLWSQLCCCPLVISGWWWVRLVRQVSQTLVRHVFYPFILIKENWHLKMTNHRAERSVAELCPLLIL